MESKLCLVGLYSFNDVVAYLNSSPQRGKNNPVDLFVILGQDRDPVARSPS